VPNLGRLADHYRTGLDDGRLQQLANGLGLTRASLAALGVGWSANRCAYTFPMADASGQVVGIRLRGVDGSKWSVRGSRAGLHIPAALRPFPGDRLLIAEGPTDCAAMVDLGFPATVGRYSCLGDLRLLADLARRWQPGDIVVVADADEPGRRGADHLASILVRHVRTVRVIIPPGGFKDVRDFLRAGGTRESLEASIAAAPVRRLRIAVGRSPR
jgi:hypothetical protein